MSTAEQHTNAADPSSAALDVQDLEVTFHRRGRRLPVLKGVTLKIERGQAYGLVGESGCGKTTLAMAAMRYLAANGTLDNGRVLVDGQDVSTLSEEALRKWRGGKVAMVYQDPTQALSPAMRIGDQLAEVFHYHEGLDKKAALEKARESLRRVAIPDPDGTLRRYPFELSGGQQQRVVIAMALAVNPQLLILDEPTTGLDATVEAEILDLIEELRGRINAAILLITHNLGLVVRLCERVGRALRRAAGRRGLGEGGLHRPASPLHHGAAALRPALRHEQDRRRAPDHPRHAPGPRRPAGGLRLLRALPDGQAGLQAARARPLRVAGRRRRQGARRGGGHAARPRRLLAASRQARRRLRPPRALLLLRGGRGDAAHDARPRDESRGARRA